MERTIIYSSSESVIFLEKTGDSKVIRKVLHAVAPDQEQIQHFHNEYEFTKGLDIPGIRKALDRMIVDGQDTLLLEYIEGTTLDEAFIGKGRSVGEILEALVSISNALAKLHEAGIIHKDVNGRNILWDSVRALPVLIDFGISSRLDYISNNLGNPDRVKGTLTHMSPEQTGRVNRKIDSRSDLYSLGITLYHILVGALPFVSEDSLELVHAHIAKQPAPVHHVNPDVPKILSVIVSKLLSKDAESRYQTAYGLAHDLRLCAERLDAQGDIAPFDLGSSDKTGKFQIPQHLYGREKEVATLHSSFDRISRGSTELVLVAGSSGVGKSALIAELFKPITERRGFFISGKFDQYKRNVPYSAIIDALDEFCQLILTEQESTLQHWRRAIQEAVGANGGILTDLVPSLAHIIGAQQLVVKLDPQEAHIRFEMVLQNFMRVVARPEHPLVLFCDDLQWADSASLRLLSPLISSDSVPYLQVIGAYRDNEIQAGHQLIGMLESARSDGAVIVDISVKELSMDNVSDMINDTLHLEQSQTKALAELVHGKTLGNAFFTLELLKSLSQKGCIHFDYSNLRWNIDFEAIRSFEISKNVVDLLVSKITSLSVETQQSLKVASVIGGRFDLEMLSLVTGKSRKDVLRDLWPSAIEGFVTPEDDAFQYVGLDGIDTDQTVGFVFNHDRVQQAAYSLMEAEECSEMHLQIGRILRDDLDVDDVFSVVDHLNQASDLITDSSERLKLAKLNMIAAQQARDSGAYTVAQTLMNMSVLYTPEGLWQSDYETARTQLYTQIEIEYLNSNFQVAEELIDVYQQRVQSDQERAATYFMLLQIRSNSGRFHEAIDSARQGLKMLGFDLPANDQCEGFIPAEMGKIIAWFTEHGVDAVVERPSMDDQRTLDIINILDNISPNAYVAGEMNLWILHVLHKVNLTIEHGLSPAGGYAFTELSLIFFIMGNYTFGHPCAEAALKITELFASTSPRHVSRAGHLYVNYCINWVRPISEAEALNSKYHTQSMDCGELIFAGYTSFFPHYTSFYHGATPLSEALTKIPDSLGYTKKIKHDLAHDSLRGLNLVLANLSGSTASSSTFECDEYTESELLAHCEKISNAFAITIYHVFKAYALYLNGDIEDAYMAAEKARSFAAVMTGCPVIHSFFNYAHSLILLARCDLDPSTREGAIELVLANQEIMKVWADNNEANFMHKYLLVEAELARVNGQNERASSLYHQAIASAEVHFFQREAALAHSCFAAYWSKLGVAIYSQAHAERAIRSLESLGYSRVSGLLARKYEVLASRGFSTTSATQSTATSSKYLTSNGGIDLLDVDSLVKSARAISESVELDALMERMLQIVIENAGAQRAVLVVPEFGSWNVRAEVDVNQGDRVAFHSEELSQSQLVPVSIINYVIRTDSVANSDSPVVAKSADRDPYIAKVKPASFFCLPITHKGVTNAIVYAEHGTGRGFISEDRFEMLKMLTGLMAVALDNASLYASQTDLVTAARRFVPQDFIRALGHQSLMQVKLGDSIMQDMTVLFGDIRSYSSIAESLSVEDNFKFINSYLNVIGPVIRRNRGFINHYLGDGYMALFPSNPEDALNAAIEITQALVVFNEDQESQGASPIKVGFGIHSGPVMMGIIGDGERQDANVISSAVNTASRLEGLTKNFASTVFFSEQTFLRLKDKEQFQIRFIGKMRLVGMEDPTSVYELFEADAPNIREIKQRTLGRYQQALEDYYAQKFGEAASAFRKIVNEFPEDHSSKRFLDLSAYNLMQGIPDDWDGVETLIAK